MKFTNVSLATNTLLAEETDKAIASKSYNRGIIAALLAAAVEVDPKAKAYAAMETSLTLETSNTVTCSFLEGTEKTVEKGFSAADIKAYPPFGQILTGDDKSTLFVLQSEYGIAVPPLTGTGGEGASCHIASPDATSCLIVAARAHLKGAPAFVSATGMGHYDRDGPELNEGIRGMYFKSLLPAIGDQIRVWRATEAGKACTASVVTVEWYFVGGMINEKYTLPCMSDMFSLFFKPMFEPISMSVQAALVTKSAGAPSGGAFTIEHSLRPDGQCFWSLNTYRDAAGRDTCTIRGLRVNVNDGSSEPFEMRAQHREYPCGHVRGTRFCSRPFAGEAAIVALNVRPGDGDKQCRYTPSEPKATSTLNSGKVVTMNMAQYLAAMRASITKGESMPIVVAGSYFDDIPSYYKNVTTAQASAMSTTPHCEPVDFGSRLASNFHYASKASTAGVFGKPALPLTNAAL